MESWIVVGLGNPGAEYAHSRHNIGWQVLYGIQERHGLPGFIQSSEYAGMISEGRLYGSDVGLLLPTGFMNNSGTAVRKYIQKTKIKATIIVVHDDIALAFGETKISYDRGAGGHNGVQSIIDTCGFKDFVRIRVGVAKKSFFGGVKRPRGDRLADFVLGNFTKSEEKLIPQIIDAADGALQEVIEHGVSYAMQEYNKRG